MANPLKIVIVGGGSYMWGPTFLRDIFASPALHGSTLVLHDIDPQALELVFAFGQKLILDFDLPFTLKKTLQLEEALEGADAVILTITTGGLEAMRHDLEIPQKYGIHHSVGDTVGPGGLARALRNIPVVVDIAQKMEALCPQAWLLNYTNPMTTLCRAITRQTKINTVGLCHELLGVMEMLKRLLDVSGVSNDEIQVRAGGINHLIWILEMKVRGQDVFPELEEIAGQILGEREPSAPLKALMEESRLETTSLVDHALVKARLFQIYRALPAAGDRHVAEFFPYFITQATDWGRKYGIALTSVEERYLWRTWHEKIIRAGLNGEMNLKTYLQKPSNEAAGPILSAIATNRQYTGIMNFPNLGQIANLPHHSVVETFGVIDSNGGHGIALGELPPGIQAVLARHVSNQEMIVEAALTGNRKLALQALLNDPMVRDLDGASRMLDEMLEANHRYLPGW